MNEPRRLAPAVVLAVPTDQIRAHGGTAGLRDRGLGGGRSFRHACRGRRGARRSGAHVLARGQHRRSETDHPQDGAAGEVLTILERGRPVAQLVPPAPRTEGFPQEGLAGTVELLGDVIEPALPREAWDAERGEGP